MQKVPAVEFEDLQAGNEAEGNYKKNGCGRVH